MIVGFALWPVLNGASNSLYAYFQDSCDDGNGNRILRAYSEDDIGSLPSSLEPTSYYTELGIHGGAGAPIVAGSSGKCMAEGLRTGKKYGGRGPINLATLGVDVFDEHGERIGETTGGSPLDPLAGVWNSTGDYTFTKVAPMLDRFSGINNLLLTVIPVVSIAGFLGISGAKLYSYGKGTSSIGSSISTSVFTLIGIVIAMVIAGPVLGQAVAANQVVVSGQYEVNGTFGNIISLLFAMIPVIYIAGLVTLVGLQARTALMGGKGGGDGM